MAHQDLGRAKLLDVATQLSEISWVESEPRTEGRVMNLVLAPGQRKRAGVTPVGRPASAEAGGSDATGSTPNPSGPTVVRTGGGAAGAPTGPRPASS